MVQVALIEPSSPIFTKRNLTYLEEHPIKHRLKLQRLECVDAIICGKERQHQRHSNVRNREIRNQQFRILEAATNQLSQREEQLQHRGVGDRTNLLSKCILERRQVFYVQHIILGPDNMWVRQVAWRRHGGISMRERQRRLGVALEVQAHALNDELAHLEAELEFRMHLFVLVDWGEHVLVSVLFDTTARHTRGK